jgi:hypothetical protein
MFGSAPLFSKRYLFGIGGSNGPSSEGFVFVVRLNWDLDDLRRSENHSVYKLNKHYNATDLKKEEMKMLI